MSNIYLGKSQSSKEIIFRQERFIIQCTCIELNYVKVRSQIADNSYIYLNKGWLNLFPDEFNNFHFGFKYVRKTIKPFLYFCFKILKRKYNTVKLKLDASSQYFPIHSFNDILIEYKER